MELQILSVKQNRSMIIEWIFITTASGSRIIGEWHEAMIAILLPGTEVIIGIDNARKESILIEKGIVEVTPQRVMLLIHE